MRVLYFGQYDPSYSRNRVLIKGLKKNGVQVIECRVDPGIFKLIRLFLRYLKMRPKYDLMIVGFPGQEVMFLARFLTFKPIIFDAFTSHYGGYILDRQYYSKNSLRAKYYRFLDKWSCRLANVVLLDTQTHIDFFINEFGLSANKFRRIWVGTDDDIFYPVPEEHHDGFVVHFHGHFIPLQGAEYIIKAASLLKNENIRFNIIGRGQEYGKIQKLADDLEVGNITWINDVPYKNLRDYMISADVCLGIFGSTPKTKLVIPNKVFEALACKKPIITADTPAIRELLSDNEAFLVKTADPKSLAEGILRLKKDPVLRNKIAEKGYNMFCTTATSDILGYQLTEIIKKLLHHATR